MRTPRTFSRDSSRGRRKCITSKASRTAPGFPQSREELHRLSQNPQQNDLLPDGSVRWPTQFSSDAPHELSRVPLSDQDYGRGRRAEGAAGRDEILDEAERTSPVVNSLKTGGLSEQPPGESPDKLEIVRDAAAPEQGAKPARRRGVKFAVRGPPRHSRFCADGQDRRRALLTLMDNTLRQAAGRSRPPRHLRLWSRSPNGIGIALGDPPSPFRRLLRRR